MNAENKTCIYVYRYNCYFNSIYDVTKRHICYVKVLFFDLQAYKVCVHIEGDVGSFTMAKCL